MTKIKSPKHRNFDTIIERVKSAKNIRYDIEVAELLGMTQSAFAERKRRNSVPYGELMHLCDEEGISYDWLLDDKGSGPDSSDFAKINIYALAGAGDAKDLEGLEPIDSIVLPVEFSFPSLVALKIRGESMEPTIYDGAVVGVDREDKHIINGKIYAVWIPYEGAVIKRVFIDPEKIILRSDNSRFPTSSYKMSELRDRENIIIGRASWVVQKL
ncbi:MAG: helix-turn-helix domain-containing protein [Candidatus Dadabacteria bacterium]|nr:helix-turn-helix domain-containing protein [Candidatus Dadabacteria bacterium]